MGNKNEIIMYGADWCTDTRRSKLYFRRQKVEYTYFDLDEHPEFEEKVRELNNGNKSVPTICFPDGSVLIEPLNNELKKKFDSMGFKTR